MCDMESLWLQYMGRTANQRKIPNWLPFKGYESESLTNWCVYTRGIGAYVYVLYTDDNNHNDNFIQTQDELSMIVYVSSDDKPKESINKNLILNLIKQPHLIRWLWH